MPTPSPLTPIQVESLQLLCRSVASDRNLRRWFDSLANLPVNLRLNAIIQLTNEMRRDEEDPDLIAAVCRLSDGDVCAALQQALAEID